MSVTGVCKNIPETLLTLLIHCIFSYFVVRWKQVNRVLGFGMSLYLFGISLFMSAQYTHCHGVLSQATKPLEIHCIPEGEGSRI